MSTHAETMCWCFVIAHAKNRLSHQNSKLQYEEREPAITSHRTLLSTTTTCTRNTLHQSNMRHFHLLFALASPEARGTYQTSQAANTGHSRPVQKLFSALTTTSTTTTFSDPSFDDVPGQHSSALLSSRRQAIMTVFGAGASVAFARKATALDMDAFMNSELESDTKNCDPKKDPKCKPKLTQDEALCKYGQSGEARGEACKRVKQAGGSLPTPGSQGRSLGGAYAI